MDEFCHLQWVFPKNLLVVGARWGHTRLPPTARGTLPGDDRIRAHPADPGACGEAKEEPMGFMDKAKQLAEQAQQKLDEAQKNFSQSASPQSEPSEGGVRYDEHGRPIQEAPTAGAAADPAAPSPPPDAASPSPPPDPASETDPAGAERPAATEGHPAGPEPTRQPEPPDRGGGQPNTAPDPFKPLQQ
jgi:hypothetical protein